MPQTMRALEPGAPGGPRRATAARRIAVAAAATLLAVVFPGVSAPEEPSAPPRALEAPTGTWLAALEHNGQRGSLALRVEPADDGAHPVLLALPDIDAWWVPIGSATWDGERLAIGKWELRLDTRRGTLTGTVPASMAPVHAIRLELRRVEQLERTGRPAVTAPRVSPAWTFSAGAPIWGGLTVEGGLLLVPDDAGELHALDPRSGEERWRFRAGASLRAAATRTGDSVLVPSDDGHLYRLAADTGEVRGRMMLGPPAERTRRGEPEFRYDHFASAAVAEGGTIYIGYGNALLALEEPGGAERWRFTTGDLVTSTPAVRGGRVFFASFDGSVYAVSAADGSLLWKHDTGAAVPSSPALIADRLVVGSRSYDLLALSPADGAVDWRYYYWFSWVESAAATRDGFAYVGSSDAQMLHAIDARTGRPAWSFDTGGSAWARPAVTEDAVYVGTVGVADYLVDHQAAVVAVDRATGAARWIHRVERPEGAPLWGFASSPAVDEEFLFVGGLDGRVHAFRQLGR